MNKNFKIILSLLALCTLFSNGVCAKADTNKEYVLGKYDSTNDTVNKADLIITTNKRKIKIFNVDMNIVNDFINWYSERDSVKLAMKK